MARKKNVEEEVAAASDVAVSALTTAPEEEVSGPSVTVSWNGGSRVFSKEAHGKDFKALAKQFAEKFNGTIA